MFVVCVCLVLVLQQASLRVSGDGCCAKFTKLENTVTPTGWYYGDVDLESCQAQCCAVEACVGIGFGPTGHQCWIHEEPINDFVSQRQESSYWDQYVIHRNNGCNGHGPDNWKLWISNLLATSQRYTQNKWRMSNVLGKSIKLRKLNPSKQTNFLMVYKVPRNFLQTYLQTFTLNILYNEDELCIDCRIAVISCLTNGSKCIFTTDIYTVFQYPTQICTKWT